MSMKRPAQKRPLAGPPKLVTPRKPGSSDDTTPAPVSYCADQFSYANIKSMDNAVKVVGYVRVSTERQAQEGVSIDAQKAKIRAYCAAMDLVLVDMISDEGFSAKNLHRPGIQRVCDNLSTGTAQGVVVVRLDRLTRSVRDLSELLDGPLKNRDLISMADNIDTRTPTGRMILHVLTSVSQWERETIGARTGEAIRHVAAVTGGWKWGGEPFGWCWGPRDAEGRLTLVPDEREQVVIARIRELVLQGMPQRLVAETLTNEGAPTKGGGPRWHQGQVAMVMRREGIASPRPSKGTGRPRTTGKGVRPLASWRYRRAGTT